MRRPRYPPPPRDEPFWPARLTILVAIGLQFPLPDRVTAGPAWLLPALEIALCVGLAIATPGSFQQLPREAALALTGLVSAANATSLGLLIHALLYHQESNGRGLVVAGGLIWLTNILIFAMWYWELDRGGPARRAAGRDRAPDFLFPQLNDDAIQPRNWRPRFLDYLYLSLTNATAFSPTDTSPLSPAAKTTMGLQSLVSLITVGLVIARAVNILH
jgi:uncharacterized membrane protein